DSDADADSDSDTDADSDADADSDSDTDADADADADADSDADTDTLPGTPVIYTYVDPQCPLNGALAPSAGEEGHWVASRITPDVTPFELWEVQAHVWQTPDCEATGAFELAVYVTTSLTPPANPITVETWSIRAVTTPGNRSLTGSLTTPLA